MTLKRALCAIMAIVMLCALTACKKDSVKSSDLEVKINGITVSASFTVEMLGSDYSVKPDTDTVGYIVYEEQSIAMVAFDENSAVDDLRKKAIKEVAGRGVSVNGITPGASRSDVNKAIGSPTEKHSIERLDMEVWYYREDGRSDDENYLMITFDANGEIYLIDVAFEWF